LSDGCGGCSYCEFPYKAKLPVKTKNGFELREFRSSKDVWNVIDLIIDETKHLNETEKKGYDVNQNVVAQLPFFACVNNVTENSYTNLINQYIYCTETGVPAYPGSYGDQPVRWLQYFFIIKNAMAKKAKKIAEKANKENK
jgi:hypothetical protein